MRQALASMTRATRWKVASAAIILATFVAHDLFREQAQSDRDAVSHTLERFYTFTDSDLIANRINESTSLAIAGGKRPDDLPLADQVRLFKADQRLIEEKRTVWGIFSDSRRILGPDFDGRLASENDTYNQMDRQSSKISNQLHGDLDRLPSDSEAQKSISVDLHEYRKTLKSVIPSTIGIHNAMRDRLLEVKARTERSLSFWKYLSAFLYFVGWAVGTYSLALADFKKPEIREEHSA